MRERRLVQAGALLRRSGFQSLSRAVVTPDNVRVVLTHHVAAGLLDAYAGLVDLLLDERSPMTPQELLRVWPGGEPIEGRRLVFTFDDGLLSSYTAAQRVLAPRGIKAMFFVPTAILDLRTDAEQHDFFRSRVYTRPPVTLPADNYRTMTAEHLRELHAQGHMVLPHTHSHARLADLIDEATLRAELERPKAILEDLLDTRCDAFAFPFGHERVVAPAPYRRVQELFAACFTGFSGVNTKATDPHFLYRDCVHPHFSASHTRSVCGGVFDPYYRLKMRRLKRRAGATR